MANISESPEMLEALIREVEEQLQLLKKDIAKLEQNYKATQKAEELLSIAHPLKGSFAAVDFEKIKTLIHEMENILDKIRRGLVEISEPIIVLLFESLDYLKMLKQGLDSDANNIKAENAIDIEITPVISKLKEILSQSKPNDNNSDTAENAEVEQKNQTIFMLDEKQQERVNQAPDHKTEGEGKKVVHTVRVDIDHLERMMELVGELVIEQIRIAQISNNLYNQYPFDETVDELIGISNRIPVLINELQDRIMKTRMISVQQLFSRFPGMVRDLSLSLNKEIDLVLEGGETEIDRTIMEEISDPLIHLIRNAIIYGIENQEIRKKLGKPEKGKLRIAALPEDSNVIITVEDDGARIDVQKIKQSAIEKMVITEQEADNMTEQQLINLIFHADFSASQNASDVSDYRVRMDIVRNHIERLNGIIDVETCPGRGTKFIIKLPIKLPLTLAILKGLLVKISNETYALPMDNVVEIVRKPKNEIESINGQAVAVIRDRAIPLVWLHDYFGVPRDEERKNMLIVLVGIAEKRFGLVVDELIGNQEVVVTNLGSYIGKVEGISGATILGDRSVACILDVVGVANIVNNRQASKINGEYLQINDEELTQ